MVARAWDTHDTPVGCPSLETPQDGQQVHRDEVSASYLCRPGFVFQDSGQRARTLVCAHGNSWNDTLPSCVNISLTSAWKRAGVESWTFSDGNNTKIVMATPESGDNDTVSRVIVPSVIMAMLFLGNAVVLYVLFMLKKRNKKKCAEDEERAAIVKRNGAAKVEESEIGTEDLNDVTVTENVVGDDRC
ncbi:hypothetical protein FOCC_FOCC007103 [Frankliniella occidentalis]|nr:hypothetical protein FOCC_FOCC007103 [Frankliniella occidentalis]